MDTATGLQAALRATSLHLACLRRQLQQTRADLRQVRDLVEPSSPPPPTARRLTLVSSPNHDTPMEATPTVEEDEVERTGPVIAVIDDDPALVALLGELLEEEGYRVLTGDGRLDTPALLVDGQPRLVILDWHCGGRNRGQQVLAALRSAPTTAAVPVLVCTTDTQMVREQSERLAGDGVAVLAKPFELDDLLNSVATLAGAPPTGHAARQ